YTTLFRSYLLGELEPDRPLPRDHDRIFEGVDKGRPGRLDVLVRGRKGILEAGACELRARAVVLRRVDLRHRRIERHEDRRRDPGLASRPGNRLAVVAGARRD